MITTADDLYEWRVVRGKEHLFRKDILKKHLSQHSIGAYRHLYNAVGHSLEAVASHTIPCEESIASPEIVRHPDILERGTKDLCSIWKPILIPTPPS